MRKRGKNYLKKAGILYESIFNSRIERKQVLERYFKLIKKSAYSGHPEGQFLLGLFFQDNDRCLALGKRNERYNQKKAVYWHKMACAQDYPEACQNLGGMYGAGEGVEKDRAMEVFLYQKAFALGLMEAGYAIGMFYKEEGEYQTAMLWLNKVLEQAPEDGETLFQLALFYYYGIGIPRSYHSAHNLFVRALQTDFLTQYSKEEIYFLIGMMYYEGNFLQKSLGKAKYMFRIANPDKDHEDINKFLNATKDEFRNIDAIEFNLFDELF